jgi:hypothetical protein
MRTLLCLAAAVLLLGGPLPARGEDFHTELMKATFKLANDKSTATAFILTRPDPDKRKRTQFILVTAAHVFETMAGDEATLFLRRRDAEGVYQKLPLKIAIRRQGKTLWTRHATADVAVMVVAPPEEAELPKLSLDVLATDLALATNEVHPGDNLCCLGYPHRVEANPFGFPILRPGTIASFPLLPTRTSNTFLFSANTFEGDSGGPVYLADAGRRLGEKRRPTDVKMILGLITGQHFLDEEARMIYGTTKSRHRLGLAIVVQAVFIKETIERLPRTPPDR